MKKINVILFASAFVVSTFASAAGSHFICFGSGRDLCLNSGAIDGTSPAVDGGVCQNLPTIDHARMGGGFQCTPESYNSCKKLAQEGDVSLNVNVGIGTDGVCYGIGG